MADIHYFPRYSQPENVVTNNSLLFLLRLHQYNRFKFEKFLDVICQEQEVQLASSWLQFRQQKSSGKSVVDGFIAQDSVKIAVETKMTEAFSPTQLKNHLTIFGAEQHKLLILLSPSLRNSSKSQLALVRKGALARNIQVVHTSFEDLIKQSRACLSDHDEDMLALVDDYESFCSDMKLLPTDEQTLFVPPCRLSFEANERFRLYYCPATRGGRNAKYIGIYAHKTIRAIGEIAKVVECAVNTNKGTVKLSEGQEALTPDEQKRILQATEEARVRDWDLSVGHKFYLSDKLYETQFRKTSHGGIWGRIYLNLEEVLGGKVPTDTRALAESLKSRTWK
jgi:hypothetical protein